MTITNKTEFENEERARIEAFVDNLFDKSYTSLCALDCTAYLSEEPLRFENRFSGRRVELREGDKWAKNAFDCGWFHLTGSIPEGYEPSELALLLDCGGEGLVHDARGNIKQSITCFASGFDYRLGMPVKRVVFVDDDMLCGSCIDVWVDCGANDLFGEMKKGSLANLMQIALVNREIRALAYDTQVLVTVCDSSPDRDFADEIMPKIREMMALPYIDEQIASRLREELKPLLQQQNGADAFTYYAVGHAHLDLCWLWPERESIRKGARTFSTQFKNIELYPDYVFGASQAQLYQWVKDYYPAVYAKVKELAKTPNWDVQGATWVEMDSNLIGAESMIRQFYYGKKFFMDEFNQEMKIFWVPDSFGYSACLPQVMRLARVPYFLTQKISWNTYNKFPYHTFHWEGLDGSQVLAHMLPEDTYNSPMRADYLNFGEKNYAERKISNVSMALFGIGDGGAGPGYEHIERAHRYRNLRGVPKVRMIKSGEFFKLIDDGKTPYPTHKGELYLEKHQGTYTTQSANKRNNRKCEYALRNYEMLMPLASKRGIALPIDESRLEKMWKQILFFQFHDILPGSSINRVYEETAVEYEAILSELTNAADYLLGELFGKATAVNFNSFSYNLNEKIAGKWYNFTVPALGAVSIGKENEIKQFSAEAGYNYIENDCVKVTFDGGFISSLYDKRLGREFVAPGSRMAVISQYTDEGDCWDIPNANANYIQTKRDAQCVSFYTHADGAKAYAECKYTVGDCVITQLFSLSDGDSAVNCSLTMDVHQQSAMLRLALPVNISTEECSFNIQLGHIKRRTTENNSVEVAQYEVSGQKFVDMSQADCGLSFINDCKYGYRCKHGIIDLDLVRCPQGGPGTDVDQGVQTVNYALLPHGGELSEATYKYAYLVNNPIRITKGKPEQSAEFAPYTSTNDAIILETIKLPQDGNGIIARFYNCTEAAQSADITLEGYRMSEVVDIPESKLCDKTDGKVTLKPFELVNIRFVEA